MLFAPASHLLNSLTKAATAQITKKIPTAIAFVFCACRVRSLLA
ncbi:hypothetical protein [Fischerella thermalis]|nr:hypothetical protein [Fischerella thermalis]